MRLYAQYNMDYAMALIYACHEAWRSTGLQGAWTKQNYIDFMRMYNAH